MGSGPEPSIEERLARLERIVDELRRSATLPTAAGPPPRPAIGTRVRAPAGADPSAEPAAPVAAPARASVDGIAAARSPVRRTLPGQTGDWRDRGESLLARGGVILLILGVAFLFKYAVDRGWITPAIRCVLGFALASAMAITGLRLHATRRRYSQILLGGSIALYYLVGFAASQLYDLVPDVAAFLFMDLASAMALLLAQREEEPLLALIGIAGAAATPSLLGAWKPNGRVLLAHTAFLALWTSRLHAQKGWRALPRAAAAAVAVLLFGTLQPASSGRALGAVVALLAWAAVGVAPMLRLRDGGPDPTSASSSSEQVEARVHAAVFTLVLAAIVVPTLWPGPPSRVIGLEGALLIGAAVVYAAVAAVHRGRRPSPGRVVPTTSEPATAAGLPVATAAEAALPAVSRVAVDVAAALLMAGTVLAFDGPTRITLLSIEAAALVLLGRPLRSDGPLLLGTVAFIGLANVLVIWVAAGGVGWASQTGPSLLLTIALAALIAWRPGGGERTAVLALGYGLGAYVALLLWLIAELHPLANHELLVSLGWGVCGATALIVGVDRGRQTFQKVGLATLAATAGKLILVDMAQVEAVWRILLFIGFGVLFLGLSYYLKRRVVDGARLEAGN